MTVQTTLVDSRKRSNRAAGLSKVALRSHAIDAAPALSARHRARPLVERQCGVRRHPKGAVTRGQHQKRATGTAGVSGALVPKV